MKRRDFCKGLLLTCAAGALYPGMEAQAAQSGAATALVGRAVPDDTYPLWYRSDRSMLDLQHSYFYSEALFDHPATEYDNRLALITLGMTLAAFNTMESDKQYWVTGEAGRADHIRDAFAKLGFAEVELFNYEHSMNDAPHTVGCAVARKTLVRNGGRVTILAAFLRGSGYGAEWADNFYVGEGSAHAGFVTAARQLATQIQSYVKRMEKKEPLGTLKFWMGGYSRSAAVANLLAAALPKQLSQLSREHTYVYTFAAPAALTASDCPDLRQDHDNNHKADGTLKPNWDASNIFNIISSGDIVPRVLPAAWGFYRNGNDRFLPAVQVPDEQEALNERGALLSGEAMRFDQLATAEETDTAVEEMVDFFESRQNFHEVYEPVFRCMLQCACTRSEDEVLEGAVLDDVEVVERLRSMDGMAQFSLEEITRSVQRASSMSRPILEKLDDTVPLTIRQMAVPMLAVGLCFNMEDYPLTIMVTFVLSLFSGERQANDVVRAALCHFAENYLVMLEFYAPEEHGMEPYTKR